MAKLTLNGGAKRDSQRKQLKWKGAKGGIKYSGKTHHIGFFVPACFDK